MPDSDDYETVGRESLTPERFARIRRIFEAALDHGPAERQAYLKDACAGDPQLLAEIKGMLVAEERNGALPDGNRPASAPRTSAPEEGRFPAGTVLAGRYRILGLLGRGGMGEVYKAFDLILNQAVALKFLTPGSFAEAALARFRNEVRIARQVSHPNVCRVYDVGMAEGLHFLSMEYIDGEDLDSLLRRIGRLPPDKAVELTRKICAGLSAAHERGVLHRDLKPSNIMIDGRGQPRITDFGLAALAQEIPLSDLGSGTPAYMSPEQKAGREVTTRSDLYSLGLVLHEMFTGKARRDTRSTPSELVKELDPVIDRVILRCLEEDPKRRPASALSVAIALPGGDPIAAALAAGETPSPEMVAASQQKEGFSSRTAWACFGAVLALLAAAAAMHGLLDLQTRAPLDIPPDALAFRARTILQQLGYPQNPADTAHGIDCCDTDFLMSVRKLDPARRNTLLATHQPAVIRFWYRQHTSLFYADSFLISSSIPPAADLTGAITYESPANTEPGMIRMQLSPKGDLVALEARPSSEETAGRAAHAVDWNPVLSAAGLDPSLLLPVQPLQVPPMAFDARAAWAGTYAAGRSEQFRVEAASWRGRVVFFNLRGNWQKEAGLAPTISRFAVSVILGAAIVLLSAGVLLARRNLRQGRGDRRGAAWVATLMFGAGFTSWIPIAHHVPAAWEMGLLVKALCAALLMATVGAVFYLAIEPFARRFWPDAFISLARLQAGRYRDPLVASHILGGVVAALAFVIYDISATRLIEGRDTILLPLIDTLGSPGYASGILLFNVVRTFITPLVLLVLLVLIRQITRRTWLAYTLGVIVMAGVIPPYGSIYLSPAMNAERLVAAALPFALLHRWGLLAFLSYQFVLWLCSFPLAPAAWYAGQTFLLLAVPAALAAWALWVVLSNATTPIKATSA